MTIAGILLMGTNDNFSSMPPTMACSSVGQILPLLWTGPDYMLRVWFRCHELISVV